MPSGSSTLNEPSGVLPGDEPIRYTNDSPDTLQTFALHLHLNTLQWVHPDDFRYLDRLYYDDAGTVELGVTTGVSGRSGAWRLGLRSSVGGGLV